ncbi:MAG: glutamyl-tRNA reductase [Anaerolineae bacterium]
MRTLTDPAATGGPAREAVVLSTCNRTEIYAVGGARDSLLPALHRTLAAVAGIDPDDLAPHLYDHANADAVRHLVGVAAGLDSMILGEAQVLGQVRAAAAEARAAGGADLILDPRFKHAVRAGRRARAETAINARAASVPSAAVELAASALAQMRRARGRSEATASSPPNAPSSPSPDVPAARTVPHAPPPAAAPDRVIVVIGAGKMALLAAGAFGKDGDAHIVVTNRDYGRAMSLARRWNGCAVTFDQLGDAVGRADIVIASTSAPHAILTQGDVEAAMRRRPDRPLVIVDIAVPRDVEPAAGDVPNVRLLDVDDLQLVVASNLAERASAGPQVERIVDAEAERFDRWLAALDVTPTIAALRRWADTVRAGELDRMIRRLGALAPRERELVQALSVALVGKLLHAPVAHLKASAGSPDALRLAATLRSLFDLSDGSAADDDAPAVPSDDDVASTATSSTATASPPAAPAHARPPRPRDAR